ncbi:ATP-binding protein [Patescibacteria group bacterium]
MEENQQRDKNEPLKIEIAMPTHAYFLSGIRDFTLTLIKNTTDFSDQWAFRFQSIVDELCSNAIEFGAKRGDIIKITYIYNPNDSIEVYVEDPGTGLGNMKAADIKKRVDEKSGKEFSLHEIRGRGLPMIVKQWTDELDFTDSPQGGIIVRVKKSLTDVKTKELKQDLSLAGDSTHIVI